MAAYIIDHDASLDVLLDECVYTSARLGAQSITAPLAADFDAFIAEWSSVNSEEIQLRSKRTKAYALGAAVDEDLNDLSDAASKTLLVITRNNREDPEYVLYFGNKRASEFKRPMLGAQLESMRAWVKPMKASSYQSLVDLGSAVETKVAEGDEAVKAIADAEQQIRELRTTGKRRQLFDKLNALRKATYGKLAEIPHAHPELKLPRNFADRFFRTERPGPAPKEPTIADLEAQLAETNAQVASLQQRIDEAKKAEAAEAAAKAQSDADAQALAEAEKQQQEWAAKAEALKKKLGKG
jgi:hypothetical protein